MTTDICKHAGLYLWRLWFPPRAGRTEVAAPPNAKKRCRTVYVPRPEPLFVAQKSSGAPGTKRRMKPDCDVWQAVDAYVEQVASEMELETTPTGGYRLSDGATVVVSPDPNIFDPCQDGSSIVVDFSWLVSDATSVLYNRAGIYYLVSMDDVRQLQEKRVNIYDSCPRKTIKNAKPYKACRLGDERHLGCLIPIEELPDVRLARDQAPAAAP